MHATRTGTLAASAVAFVLVAALCAGCGGWQKFPGDRATDTVAPAPPTNLAATGGDQQVSLTWTASTSPDVTEYYVYVRLDGTPDWGDANRVGNVTQVVLTGLTNGELYWVRVRAVDGYANLSLPASAAEVSFTTLPAVPASLTVAAVWQNNALGLDLDWPASSSPTVQGYTIFVSVDGGVTWSTAIDAGDVQAYLLTAFNNLAGAQTIQYSTTYNLALEAYDANGLRSARQTAQTLTPPAPPTALTGVGLNASVRLYWVASASTGAVDLLGIPIFSGYTLFVSSDNGTSWDAGVDVLNVTTVLVTQNAAGVALVNGQPYLFRVRARDTASQLSIPDNAAQVSVTPTNVQQAPPGPVPWLTLVPGNQYIDASWTMASGTVGWYEVSWVAGIYTGTNYPTAGVTPQFVQPNVFTYHIAGLSNGTPYSVRLRAADASQVLFSNPATVRTATPGADNVIVTYSAPGGAYRYRAALPGDSTLPNALDLAGVVDGTNPGGGILYYTVDESNPVISAARKTPDGSGVHDASAPADSTGTFYQANSATGLATKLNLRTLMPGRNYIRVKVLFDPDGVMATSPPVVTNDEGITCASTYFVFDAQADTLIPFGGTNEIRRMHTADLLAGGSVFVGGGTVLRVINPSVTVHQPCELFNKDVEFFFPTASGLGTPRTEHRSVVLDDGRLFLHGGRRQTPALQDLASDLAQYTAGGERLAEIYDPVAKTFANVGAAGEGTPRCLHQIVKLTQEPVSTHNLVLIVGGVSLNTAAAPPTGSINLGSSASTILSNIAPSSVAAGDIVVIVGGPANGDSQFVAGVTVNLAGETVIYLEARISATPYPGGTIEVRRPSYSQCEFFDQDAATPFLNAATMPDSRFGHQASLLQDGRVLVTGGYYPPEISGSDIELTSVVFDPTIGGAQGTWVRCGTGTAGGYEDNSAKMQSNRYFHTATVLMNGKVLVAGGVDNGTGYFMGTYYDSSIVTSCDLVDVAGRSASEITARATGQMRKGRFFHTATLLGDGRVLITGGIDYVDSSTGAADYTSTAELYDPSTGTFAYTGSMLEPRWGHAATLLDDGRVLITGGRADALPETYDPSTGKFSATAGTMTGNHELHPEALPLTGGKILITGGQRPNEYDRTAKRYKAGPILSIAELWDPSNSLFTPLPNMSQPRKNHTLSLLDDGRVLVAGGEGGTGTTPVALSSTEIFNPRTKTFSAGPNMSARYGHSAVTLNPVRYYRTGTAAFTTGSPTGTVTGTGTAWASHVLPGDRIRLDSDPNGAFFEIAAVAAGPPETLTIRAGAGFNLAIPTTTASEAYTIRIERDLTGNATFTFNSAVVTGTATDWRTTLAQDMVIAPTALVGATRTADFYVIQTVDSDTQVTLTRAYRDRSSPGAVPAPEPFTARGNSRVLILGGGASGQPLNTGEVFDSASSTFESCLNTLTLGRYQHTATVLDNGWVLIVGGNSNYDRTAELFDPAMKRFLFLSTTYASSTWTNASRNNHTACRMANGYVYIVGGEIAQTVSEFFNPDSDNDPTADAGFPTGIAGLDLNASSFSTISTAIAMVSGRVEHTLTYLQGTPTERVLLAGGTSSGALTTAQFFSWNESTTTANYPTAPALGRSPLQAHAAVLAEGNANVVIMKDHTVQICFTQ